MAPLTRRVSLTRTPCAPPSIESQGAVGSQRTSGASRRRLLTTSRLAVTLLLKLKAPVAAVLPTVSWVMSAVVAFRLLAASRRHRHVPVEADASVGEAGQQRAVFLADRYQGVLDLEVARCALHGASLDGQIGGGGDAAAVLQGGDAAVDGADLRLQGGHAAVDGRDRAAERVEVRNQGVAPVALGLAPAVALEFERAEVAQCGPRRQSGAAAIELRGA